MAGIGNEEYPEIPPSEAIAIVEKIRDKKIRTLDTLQTELGYSSASVGGKFYYKRVALERYYGLITCAKKDLALSSIGQRIAHVVSPDDRQKAISESIRGIPLFVKLYDTLGFEYNASDFKPKLRDITNATPSELDKKAAAIEKMFRDAASLLKGSGPASQGLASSASSRLPLGHHAGTPTPPEPSNSQGGGLDVIGEDVRLLHYPGKYLVKIRINAESLDEAIVVLTAYRSQLDKKTKQSTVRENDARKEEGAKNPS